MSRPTRTRKAGALHVETVSVTGSATAAPHEMVTKLCPVNLRTWQVVACWNRTELVRYLRRRLQ